jgi:sec-independent protein translocase protein TatC
MSNERKLPFLGHLEELRSRLVASAIAVGIGFAACYGFSEKLFLILASPLTKVMPQGDHLIFTSLPEMFFTQLKVSFVGGLILASPVVFYELWMFVAPGLYRNEKKLVIPFVAISTALFAGGALFAYFVVFPFGFKFFLGFSSDYVKALPSVKQYFSFSIKLLLAFGLVFDLPVVIFFLAKLGIVTTEFLKKKRKYAILLAFITSAILTPPDVITQCMMAVPLIALYEVGIVVSRFAKPAKPDGEEEAS